ncbi:hypothetical protein chiPu_0009570 [Chiloscyllium punctatum]|uniref:Ig-like domain-containing protein n=1 Tax=Chiloscyllium punctatum TaxID=137246 RepID=A0A401SL45_CHIPU|nr:hypothetical protein [Chiloscyllium punctatum]
MCHCTNTHLHLPCHNNQTQIHERGELTKCPFSGSTTVFTREGEHARLRCKLCNASTPLALHDLQTHGFNISWFHNASKVGRAEFSGNRSRITLEGTSLGFWPTFVNDSGNYFCSVSNGTHKIVSAVTTLNVKKNKGLCHDDAYPFSQHIGRSIMLPCPKLGDYSDKKENIIWLKNCTENVHTGAMYTIQKVQEESAGLYMCVLPLENGGVQYNVTRTLNLKAKEYIEPFKPKLIYPIDEQIELGLGEKREIECKAIANKEAVDFCVLFWNFNHNYLTSGGNDVYENSSRIVPEDNRVSVIAPLVFMKIKKEHLNKTFQCVLTCQDTQQIGNIILLEKGKGDTDPVVLPIIMAVAVFISVAVVYVKFKIYFVLCFRDFISRDETLEDSKEYDAYVLLLKSNDAVLSAKEETFALEVLPSILEEKFGYRLCIFERDVLPGGGRIGLFLSS